MLFRTSKCSVLLVLSLAMPCFAEISVVVNPAVKVGTLSQDDVSDLFLGKASSFKDGSKAEAIDQDTSSGTRSKFYQGVLNKSESQLKAYWARLIFTGKGQPPAEKGDDASVKALVAKNPSFVGYIDSSHVDSTVKVVYKGS